MQKRAIGSFVYGMAGVLVGVVLASTLPAFGANGENMILGASNRAGKSTWVASKGPEVMKLNNTAGNPVLDLRNSGGSAPLQVDSSIMVDDFNADLLDGRHATSVAPRIVFVSSSDLDDAGGNDMLYTDIEVPAAGVLLMGLSVDVDRSGSSGADALHCGFVVSDSGVWAGSSSYNFQLSDDAESNTAEDCTITDVHLVDAAGTYKVEGQVNGLAADTTLGNGSLWAMWIPVDGSTGDFFE